jgi:hypothetical protein
MRCADGLRRRHGPVARAAVDCRDLGPVGLDALSGALRLCAPAFRQFELLAAAEPRRRNPRDFSVPDQ